MTVVNSKKIEYTILVDVELLHDGRQEQHKLQAAEPQQQARDAALITQPIAKLCNSSVV